MTERDVISYLGGWNRREDAASLDEYVAKNGRHAWDRLCDAARGAPRCFDAPVLDWVAAHAAEVPGSVVAILLLVAGKDEKLTADERAAISRRARELAEARPAESLGAAGYQLHENWRALDEAWLAFALRSFGVHPEGAWGIVTAAAWLRPDLLTPAVVGTLDGAFATRPRDWFVAMIQLAGNDAGRREALLARVLELFDAHPEGAVDAAGYSGREDALATAGLVDAVARHVAAAPERAWEYLGHAAKANPPLFDDARLDALERSAGTGPKHLLDIVKTLAVEDDARAPRLMERFVRLLRAWPKEGIDAAYYLVHNQGLIRPDLLDAVCEHFDQSAYHAFDILAKTLHDRPELLKTHHVEAALRNVGHATNWAFGFFREVLRLRPEWTPLGVAALFECLALEPVNRATTRQEELQEIVTIAQASHVATELERVLREPPPQGSRRARALMAILFRQRSRSKQHVLFEALRFTATACTWSDRNTTPLWDFFLFLIDEAPEDAVSTAAAERFLEGAFQLSYLMERGNDHDEFRAKFNLGEPPGTPWPLSAAFLARDAELSRLFAQVSMLGKRFDSEPRLAPLEEFERRAQSAEIELSAIEARMADADAERKAKLEARRAALNRQLACWINPEYARALSDPAREAKLSPDAKALAARERRDLSKHVRDALRAELVRIAVRAVDGSRMDLYRSRIRGILGRDVDLSRVDASILPSFLFFSSLGAYPNNRKYLARLIEDRIEGRPHDWLWTEPPAAEWKERLAKALPGIRFDRWRAAFSRDIQYRPKDAAAERKRRIKDDLAQARKLLEQLGATGFKDSSREELEKAWEALRAPPEVKEGEKPPEPPDPAVMNEIAMNLERVRIVENTPVSDYEGRITLEVETDPFEILFMGEYGFASCLSLRGPNVWSAVSNAIDVDKGIVWAKEGNGNVVGRRLIALTEKGLLSYRTYANRHGLSLDGMFERFVEEYAAHVGVPVVHKIKGPGELISDRWYDDGAI